MKKHELRLNFKNIRNNVNFKEDKNRLIRKNFVDLFLSEYKTFFVYKSFSSEVDTEGIINDLFNNNKNVLIPKCDIKTETMNPVEISRLNSFELNAYGIPEVCADEFAEEKIDVIILPGLIFDKKGYRVGYGKGYYDKFIGSLKYKPMLVGLAYDEQIIDFIDDTNEYDVRLDCVITDRKIYYF